MGKDQRPPLKAALQRLFKVEQAEIILPPLAHHDAPRALRRIGDQSPGLAIPSRSPRATTRTRWKPCRGRRSEEHTSELQSLLRIPYAVFFLTKTKYKESTTN